MDEHREISKARRNYLKTIRTLDAALVTLAMYEAHDERPDLVFSARLRVARLRDEAKDARRHYNLIVATYTRAASAA